MQNNRKKLVYVTDEQSGYRRKKWGRGHIYFDPAGHKIKKSDVPERILELKIPPMWREVWVCARENGHLQATGYDEKGRKQYLYHADWLAYRNANKFNRIISFARKLPEIRRQVQQDLEQPDWTKRRVQALVVRVLDESYIRIGNKSYLEENNTYGLTTLRRKHLQLEEDEEEAVLRFQAKSGKQRELRIEKKELVGLIKECSELPGYEIFRYLENGKGKTIDSGDVNEYLQEVAGEEFSSKDFRTWGGTVTAIEEFEAARKVVAENPRKELLPTLVNHVAERLGNTAAVCREYYIHPAVLTAAEDGRLAGAIRQSRATKKSSIDLDRTEKIALRILEEYAQENEPQPVLKEE